MEKLSALIFIVERASFKISFYSGRLRKDVSFVAFLGHIAGDMPREKRRASTFSRAAFMTKVILIQALAFSILYAELSDSVKVHAISIITKNLAKYDSLYQSIPDTAKVEKRVLKQIMQNDIMKLVIAEKNQDLKSYQATNALRWLIGNIGFTLFIGFGIFAYKKRSKKAIIILIVLICLYFIGFNLFPELMT
jgi:hypothetical protein